MKKINVSLLDGPILPNVIRYTIPVILTGMLQLAFNAADLMIVGRFSGSLSVAAVGATSSLTHLFINGFIGLSVGAGVAVARGIGRDDDEAVSKTVHTAILASIIGGALLSIIGVSFSEIFLAFMGTPDNVISLSALYMRIYFSGIIFSMLYNFSASILRAAGDTQSPLISLIISGIINVILNVFFVTAFNMDVAGVALATIISQAISSFYLIFVLSKRTDNCKLDLRKLQFNKTELKEIIRIGLPAGIQSSLFSISNVIIQSSVNSFGDVFVSGNAAASNIDSFIYVATNSFYQTSINFIGQNSAARKYDRVKKIFLTCLCCTVVSGIVLGLGAYLFGHELLSLYITDSEQAIQYGFIRLSIMCLSYFLCGTMDVSTGALRGIGASITPMIISVAGICLTRLVWIFTIFQIPSFHTPAGLFISYPISWILTTLCHVYAFIIIFKKVKLLYPAKELHNDAK